MLSFHVEEKSDTACCQDYQAGNEGQGFREPRSKVRLLGGNGRHYFCSVANDSSNPWGIEDISPRRGCGGVQGIPKDCLASGVGETELHDCWLRGENCSEMVFRTDALVVKRLISKFSESKGLLLQAALLVENEKRTCFLKESRKELKCAVALGSHEITAQSGFGDDNHGTASS